MNRHELKHTIYLTRLKKASNILEFLIHEIFKQTYTPTLTDKHTLTQACLADPKYIDGKYKQLSKCIPLQDPRESTVQSVTNRHR